MHPPTHVLLGGDELDFSPLVTGNHTHAVHLCCFPDHHPLAPLQEGDLLLLVSHQSWSAYVEEGHSKC